MRETASRLTATAPSAAMHLPDQGTPYERMKALSEDMNGQISEAINNMEYFRKWGRHYITSLGRSHGLQQCNNFKDPGIQCYGGELFRTIRDFADDQFCSLPVPVLKTPPSVTATRGYSGSSTGPASVTRIPSSMAAYNSRDQPCFHGDCKVTQVLI